MNLELYEKIKLVQTMARLKMKKNQDKKKTLSQFKEKLKANKRR